MGKDFLKFSFQIFTCSVAKTTCLKSDHLMS